MSKGQTHTGTRPVRRTLGRCSKGKTKNAVCVDVENGKSHDYIFIDAPEFSEEPVQGSSLLPKKLLAGNFINVDDDESNVEYTENGDKAGHDHENGVILSKDSHPSSSQTKTSKKSIFDDIKFARGKRSPVTFSKSRRTYSEKTCSRNCYGLHTRCDSVSSDSDGSDCELMEESSGNIREQWERAALKKKMVDSDLNGRGGDIGASGSGFFRDTSTDVEVENLFEQHVKVPFSSLHQEYTKPTNMSTSNDDVDDMAEDPDCVANLEKDINYERPSSCRTPPQEEAHTSHEHVYMHDRGKTFRFPHSPDAEMQSDDVNGESCDLMKESEIFVEPQFYEDVCFQNKADSETPVESQCFEDIFSQEKEENVSAQSFWFNYEEKFDTGPNHEETSALDEEAPLDKNGRSERIPAHYERNLSSDVDEINHLETCFTYIQTPNYTNCEKAESSEKESLFSAEPSFWCNQSHERMHASSDTISPSQNDESVPGEYISNNNHMQDDSGVVEESVSHKDKKKPAAEYVSSKSEKKKLHVIHPTTCSLDERESEMDNNAQPEVETSSSHAESANDAHDAGNIIIGDREKLKETDEYKRAAEEEWASRQRQLQLQAEEVQRLRKRKRAEAQRLLDMERRQKERVEEMRETQKKNVETINLKEHLRAEVRKELDKLEVIHTDMVSLLRALGIRVGAGFCPTSHEINAAYKQALLKFHPDRASKNDVRQQVEAEEKFKLVSRLKEKLTSFTPKFF